MSSNWHWNDQAQRLESGLAPISTMTQEGARELAERLLAHADDLHQQELPMLKGSGFIVIDPRNPRFDGEEHANFEDAKDVGSNVAYQSGTAIIYAPVLVMRPKRETAQSQPSKLLSQLALDGATKITLPAAPETFDVGTSKR